MNKETYSEIAVLGKKIPTTIEEVDIFTLTYWKENPRVNAIIKQKYKNVDVTDMDIEKELWEKDAVKDLYSDIEKHGGLIDEILVKGNVVLEGNSRLCAYRHLYNHAKEKRDFELMERWSKIRSRLIPIDTTNQTIFSILGTWHIKGKSPWDTYEKAAYLKRMNVEYGVSIDQIALSISESPKFVQECIEAYDLMVKNNVYTLEKYSYFYELVREKNKKANKQIFIQEPQIVDRVIDTILNDKNVKRAETIRELPKILKDQKAKKQYLNNEINFGQAIERSESKHPEVGDSFYNQIVKTTKLLQDCTLSKIDEIKGDSTKKYYIKNLKKETENLCKKIGIKD